MKKLLAVVIVSMFATTAFAASHMKAADDKKTDAKAAPAKADAKAAPAKADAKKAAKDDKKMEKK